MTSTPTATIELWTIEDIAVFYKRSPRQARRIVSDAAFPGHVRGDKLRWVSTHVMAYAADVSVPTVPDLIGPSANATGRIVRKAKVSA